MTASPSRWRPRALRLAATALLVTPAAAQFDRPEERVRQIADEIAEEMREIDRLLLQRPAADAAEGMARAAERMNELLRQTGASQGSVATKIDELIREIQKLQREGQGGGQDQPPPSPSQRQPRTRREPSERPENAPSTDAPPEDNRPPPQDQGRNQPAAVEPRQPTEEVEHGTDHERWGVLPFYEEFNKTRGGVPLVPEKYRRYHEAFLKQSRKGAAAPGGTPAEKSRDG